MTQKKVNPFQAFRRSKLQSQSGALGLLAFMQQATWFLRDDDVWQEIISPSFMLRRLHFYSPISSFLFVRHRAERIFLLVDHCPPAHPWFVNLPSSGWPITSALSPATPMARPSQHLSTRLISTVISHVEEIPTVLLPPLV